jgi:putative flippase GtrA
MTLSGARSSRLARNHGARLSVFSFIGAVVFVAGLAFQVALVRYAGLGADLSYAAQAIFSIELSYLLNRYVTWRDRDIGFWLACWKFTAQKLVMTVVNMTAYALLVRAGVQYVAANIALTAVFTPVNYLAADLLVFVGAGLRGRPREEEQSPSWLPDVLPTVSVVIPCKDSGRTIRQAVEGMLAQDYPALAEVILVGDIGDSTWAAIADIDDPRLVLLEQEKTPGRRDPNVKRDKGIRKSSGDILALADSDVVPEAGWLTCAIGLLHGQGGGLVAGGLRSADDTFWGRFVDHNALAPKMPRVRHPYHVTAATFGARGRKPPVTANAVFTRELYDACQLDVTWAYGYEDYEWFWRLARAGHDILISPQLTMRHHHRRSFRQLVREYQRSAHGCAQFVKAHPDSPLSRKRLLQASGIPLALVVTVCAAAFGVASGDAGYVAAILGALVAAGAGYEATRAGSIEAVSYAPASLALGGIYATTMAANLLRPAALPREAPLWAADARPPRRTRARRANWPLTAVLGLQACLSMGLVWSNTAFGDEATYLSAGRLEWEHLLHGTPLPGAGQANFGFAGTFQSYFSGAPQVYPPLGAALAFLGGLGAARILGLCFMLGASCFLYLTASRLCGRRAAIFGTAVWAVSAPVLRLAFATYDPMAIFLVCAGTWTAVEAGWRRHRPEVIATSAFLLAFGAVTAYSYAIFAPVAILLAGISWTPRIGWRSSVAGTAWLAALAVALMVFFASALRLWQGIFSTTFARRSGDSGVLSVAQTSWELTGLIAILALMGAIAAFRSRSAGMSERLILGCCAAAALMVPLEQARLRTGTSLDKHLSLGAWFASIAAGYALSQLVMTVRWRRSAVVACAAAAVAFPATDGWISAFGVYHLWPNAASYIAAMRPLVAGSKGNLLVVQYSSMTEYYLGATSNWERWIALSLDPSYAGVAPAGWAHYYQSQIAAESPQVVAVPMDVTFTSQAAGELLLANLTSELRTGRQAQLRRVLLQIAAADVSSTEPGFYDLASAVAADPDYHVVAVTRYDSHIATGVFVVWQRSDHGGGQHHPAGAARVTGP